MVEQHVNCYLSMQYVIDLIKYFAGSDKLFSLEIDRVKAESIKSAMSLLIEMYTSLVALT